jgi:Mg-chelatase subunit ChlD
MAAQMRPWKTIFIRHTLVLPCIVAAGLLLKALAQETPCLQHTVIASVTLAGQPVASVPTSSFKGEFRGKPVRILSATRDVGPRRIVVLLDASASMAGLTKGKWDLVLRAASDVAAHAPPDSSVALLVFNDKVKQKVDFSAGPKAVLERIAQVRAGRTPDRLPAGRSPLLDAVLEGLKLLEPATPGDVIYAISDGGDNASKSSPVAVQKALVSAGIRLFAFLVVDYPEELRVPEKEAALIDFLQLVQATGGSALHLSRTQWSELRYPVEERDRLALKAATEGLYLQMAQFYRLEVDLPEPVTKPRRWKLEMVNERGAKMKEWQVAYQTTLLPCKSTTEPSKENK